MIKKLQVLVVVFILSLLVSAISKAHEGHAANAAAKDKGHLKFANGKIHAHLSWIQTPSLSAEAKMQLEWHDGATHNFIEIGKSFEVVVSMPTMGHKPIPTVIEKQKMLGVYQVSHMYFYMPGDWEVRVSLSHADGFQESQVWNVNIPEEKGLPAHKH